MTRIISVFFFVALAITPCAAQQDTIPIITKRMLDGDPASLSRLGWKFLSSDDTTKKDEYTALRFNDTTWKRLSISSLHIDSLHTLWSGVGWYRLVVKFDTSLHNRALGFWVEHRGASEIYLDGKLVMKYGTVSSNATIEESYRPLNDYAFFVIPTPTLKDSLSAYTEHCIAIRYSDTQGRSRANLELIGRSNVGFNMSLWYAERWYALSQMQSVWTNIRMLLSACLFALCFVHFIIYLNTGGKHHINYIVFAFLVGFYFFSQVINQEYLHTGNLSNLILNFVGQSISLPIAFVFCLGLFYRILYSIFPKRLMIIWGIIPFPIMFGGYINNFLGENGLYILIGLIFAEIMRVIGLSIYRKRPNAWVLGIGGILLVVAIGAQILSQLGVFRFVSDISLLLIPIGFLSIPVSMSVYLSRSVAETNRSLAEQLKTVKTLTEKTIQQEVAQQLLAADNTRKTLELEQARALQLSMLPRTMPTIAGLDIAMAMQTSSEVGGDYYDYFADTINNSVTIAIGDATGHGVKAGTMVAATKSLLTLTAHDESVSGILQSTSPALKRMNLRGMFMALMMVRIENRHCTISNGGMPSAILYRSATNSAEEISLKAMPLGSLQGIQYQEHSFDLQTGDVLVMMSDGFPERFNAQEELLGYDKAPLLCTDMQGLSAQNIIQRFVKASEEWAQGAPLNDDMTFVVVRAV